MDVLPSHMFQIAAALSLRQNAFVDVSSYTRSSPATSFTIKFERDLGESDESLRLTIIDIA